MTQNARLFVGLMSGTSADSIDAVLISFSQTQNAYAKLEAFYSHPLTLTIQKQIFDLSQPGHNEIQRLGSLDITLAKEFAQATNELCRLAKIDATQIEAIGSHGQTIRHHPEASEGVEPFSLQIGDPNTIAKLSNIAVVADFRRKDIAYQGQGAPLVPAFHESVFKSETEERCIVNIGGISNISILSNSPEVTGYDTGPGNTLLDGWIRRHMDKAYDDSGAWASQGQIHNTLLSKLISHPYFTKAHPKSTGREEFHLEWLDHVLHSFSSISPADVQATLTELSALSIADAINKTQIPNISIYVCGGGAHNNHLLARLSKHLPQSPIQTTDVLGIHPDWVEAAAFAWLAMRRIDKLPGNIPCATGATSAAILGGIYTP